MQTLTIAALLACMASTSLAQGSGINLELHANQNVTASSMGLPGFPNARPSMDASSDSAVDLGFSFGDVHFRVLAAKYVAAASPSQVLDFYRKPLARYGEVLECDHGKPIGPVTVTDGGLTCSASHGHGSQPHFDSDDGHQLRSGSKRLFRVVAIDTLFAGETHFSLVYLEVPKGDDSR